MDQSSEVSHCDIHEIEKLTHNNRIQAILEPLAIAANITQASHTRLDHVLLTLGNLFRIYTNASIDGPTRERILASLEKRWAQADQDIFIVAVFLNPYIRKHIFNPAAVTESSLFSVVERVFERVFNRRADLDLLKAFTDYAKGTEEFSDREMHLDQMAEMHAQEVCGLSRLSVMPT